MQKELFAKYEGFLKSFRDENIQGVAYIGIVLILLGAGLDYRLYPDMQYLFASVRVGASVIVYSIILLMSTSWGKSRIQLLNFVWLLVPQIMISWMIWMTEGASSIYWTGLILAIFAAGIVLNFSLRQNIAFGAISNANERKQAEIALHASEEKYRGLFENAGDFAYGTDLKGCFTAVSASMLKVTGYSLSELINSHISIILTPDNLALAQKMTRAKVEANTPVTRYELEITDKTGKQIPLELVSTLTYMNGVPIGVQGLGRDISARKKNELALHESIRKLEEKELAKTRFLAAAGHDLRQPLAAANLFIDALKFTQLNSDQNRIVLSLDQAMSNFNVLLDALLNVSKLDAGLIKPEYSLIKVASIFEWLEQSFAPMANEKHIRFKLHFPIKENLTIRTDRGLLNSVLMNLVSNAIKFTSHGGILVSARQRGTELLFQVWDTGIGISDTNIKLIFDEFYQINNPQRDRTSGLGLGLAIAKRAIAIFDGEITCHSKVGKGSVFEFCLPLADFIYATPDTENIALSPLQDQSVSIQGKLFMVVEDDALVAEALSNTLVRMGAKVMCFHSAETALDNPSIEEVDYFIVDYMIAGALNGIQLVERIHEIRGKPIKAVIMTGETSTSFIREAATLKWPVVHKPVNISKIITALKTQAN